MSKTEQAIVGLLVGLDMYLLGTQFAMMKTVKLLVEQTQIHSQHLNYLWDIKENKAGREIKPKGNQL